MRFVIVGVTLSGNMGGSAMLHATLQQLRTRFPQSQFELLSIYPKNDLKCNREKDLQIVSASPLILLGIYLPLTIFAGFFPKLKAFIEGRFVYFKTISRADAIVDLSGISFVDGRGVFLLWYNLSCVLPGLVWRKPVFKLSQALGPFDSRLNRTIAKYVLRKTSLLIARGNKSKRFLCDIGLDKTFSLPDVSFVLKIPPRISRQAQDILKGIDPNRKSWVVVSPSQVVSNLCEKHGIDFLDNICKLVSYILQDTSINVLIMPHSLGTGKDKNNDILLSKMLYARLNDLGRVFLFIPEQDPILIRAIIAKSSFFVGCRFHAVVASLISGVPTLIIGWSHKYAEMAESFDANIPSLDFSLLSSDALIYTFKTAWNARLTTRKTLIANRELVRKSAMQNFDLLERELKKINEVK